MTNEILYENLQQAFGQILDRYGIDDKSVRCSVAEVPDGDGARGRLVAEYDGSVGECVTSFPDSFQGSLAQVLAFDITNDALKRSVFVAVLNAVMNKYLLSDDCVSCDESDASKCAARIAGHYKKNNGKIKLLLAGYQPHILKALAEQFPVRVLDTDPALVGKTFEGVAIEDEAQAFSDAVWWADAILCSGSALADGTIVGYMNMPKDVMYYGTTIAGCARILELRRQCPFAGN